MAHYRPDVWTLENEGGTDYYIREPRAFDGAEWLKDGTPISGGLWLDYGEPVMLWRVSGHWALIVATEQGSRCSAGDEWDYPALWLTRSFLKYEGWLPREPEPVSEYIEGYSAYEEYEIIAPNPNPE